MGRPLARLRLLAKMRTATPSGALAGLDFKATGNTKRCSSWMPSLRLKRPPPLDDEEQPMGESNAKPNTPPHTDSFTRPRVTSVVTSQWISVHQD